MIKQTQLVTDDFFPDTIKVNLTEIFPVAVVATMSSGKSTMINALMGKEILPYSNTSCTSRAISILDDDKPSKEIICATDCYGKTTLKEYNLREELARLNENPNIRNIFIRSHVRNVFNTNKALLLIDTPGPNNSQNGIQRTELITLLNKLRGGLVLYVLNATCLGVEDDKKLLKLVQSHLSQRPELHVAFLLNKIDVLDQEKESVKDIVLKSERYLKECGFVKPEIMPVSSRAAVLFNKALWGEKLTRKERNDFEFFYDIFKPQDFNMARYCITEELPWQFEKVCACGNEYTVGQLRQAINNTGIKVIENYIQKVQILNDERPKNTIRAKVAEN